MDGEILKIIVTDNGKGRSESSTGGIEKNKSLGLSTISKRLDLLNIKFKTSCYRLIITDLCSENKPCGTKAELNLLAIHI